MSLWRAEFQQNVEKVSLLYANPAILLSAGNSIYSDISITFLVSYFAVSEFSLLLVLVEINRITTLMSVYEFNDQLEVSKIFLQLLLELLGFETFTSRLNARCSLIHKILRLRL